MGFKISNIGSISKISVVDGEAPLKTTQTLAETIRSIQIAHSRAIILNLSNFGKFLSESAHESIVETFDSIADSPIPIITIAKGNLHELDLKLVIASHICIASNSSVFDLPIILSDWMVENNLQHEVSGLLEKNKYLADLARSKSEIDVESAQKLGLVNRVIPAEEVDSTALEIAIKISELAPVAVQNCLRAVNQGLRMSLDEGLKLESKLFAKMFSTEDMREGTRAFLEKRKPKFVGR